MQKKDRMEQRQSVIINQEKNKKQPFFTLLPQNIPLNNQLMSKNSCFSFFMVHYYALPIFRSIFYLHASFFCSFTTMQPCNDWLMSKKAGMQTKIAWNIGKV